jgi:hypothetical protein
MEERTLARRPHYELAICAIFREEAPFLDEWLTFHSGIGVTHFFLYNNRSTDAFRPVLDPWIARGAVTLHDWPQAVEPQLPAYRHCVRNYRHIARWIAFIDLDEFLFSPRMVDIRPILRDYIDLPGVLVYQLFFGAAGHATRPPTPLANAFIRRATPDKVCGGKTIANPRMIYAVRSPHVFKYWSGEALDTLRRALPKGRTEPVFDTLRINHYWSRSIEDLRTKVQRGDASSRRPRILEEHFVYEAQLNTVEDRSILPITAAIHAQQ